MQLYYITVSRIIKNNKGDKEYQVAFWNTIKNDFVNSLQYATPFRAGLQIELQQLKDEFERVRKYTLDSTGYISLNIREYKFEFQHNLDIEDIK